MKNNRFCETRSSIEPIKDLDRFIESYNLQKINVEGHYIISETTLKRMLEQYLNNHKL